MKKLIGNTPGIRYRGRWYRCRLWRYSLMMQQFLKAYVFEKPGPHQQTIATSFAEDHQRSYHHSWPRKNRHYLLQRGVLHVFAENNKLMTARNYFVLWRLS